jgi:dinuclear metal center YbgI/SA1388 family protein
LELAEIVNYLDTYLEVANFRDYAPNGLQVEGRKSVAKVALAVSASAEVVEQAIVAGADAIIVHHGYFWKGEDPCLVGVKGNRVHLLMTNGMSLLAYHLPLDAHPEVGNNVGLAKALDIHVKGAIGPEPSLVLHGELSKPLPVASFSQRLAQVLGRDPVWLAGASETIRTLAWCTGAAADYVELAATAGVDAFVTGEVSERTFHMAAELGVHVFGAGHHATERFGVQALGEHLFRRFDLQTVFIDQPNPI